MKHILTILFAAMALVACNDDDNIPSFTSLTVDLALIEATDSYEKCQALIASAPELDYESLERAMLEGVAFPLHSFQYTESGWKKQECPFGGVIIVACMIFMPENRYFVCVDNPSTATVDVMYEEHAYSLDKEKGTYIGNGNEMAIKYFKDGVLIVEGKWPHDTHTNLTVYIFNAVNRHELNL